MRAGISRIGFIVAFGLAGCGPTTPVAGPHSGVSTMPAEKTLTNDATTRSVAASQDARLSNAIDQKFNGYYFAMDQVSRTKFTTTVNGLKFGDKASIIKAALGEPASKGAGHGFTFVKPKQDVYSWTYVVARYRQEDVTEGKDEYVYLYFDDQDKLDSVLSSGCPEVASR